MHEKVPSSVSSTGKILRRYEETDVFHRMEYGDSKPGGPV